VSDDIKILPEFRDKILSKKDLFLEKTKEITIYYLKILLI